MSTKAAFQFIQSIRSQDTALKERVGQDADLDHLVQIGAEAGFEFTAEELREAYKHHWAMRWHLYQSRADG